MANFILDNSGNRRGPYSIEQLRQFAVTGNITPSTIIRVEYEDGRPPKEGTAEQYRIPFPSPSPPTVPNTQYEFKVVPVSKSMVTQSGDEESCIRRFQGFLNSEASGGWMDCAKQNVTGTSLPGCLSVICLIPVVGWVLEIILRLFGVQTGVESNTYETIIFKRPANTADRIEYEYKCVCNLATSTLTNQKDEASVVKKFQSDLIRVAAEVQSGGWGIVGQQDTAFGVGGGGTSGAGDVIGGLAGKIPEIGGIAKMASGGLSGLVGALSSNCVSSLLGAIGEETVSGLSANPGCLFGLLGGNINAKRYNIIIFRRKKRN